MHRLFVAIRPPVHIRQQLLGAMGGIANARWQSDDQLHLTLRFIGEVDRHQAQDCAAALARITHPAFEIMLDGAGLFDRRGRADALWIGVTPHMSLKFLHNKIDQALARIGIAPDTRTFLPHITIARLGATTGPIGGFMDISGGLKSAAFAVDGFGLFESELGRAGSAYHVVERYLLR